MYDSVSVWVLQYLRSYGCRFLLQEAYHGKVWEVQLEEHGELRHSLLRWHGFAGGNGN